MKKIVTVLCAVLFVALLLSLFSSILEFRERMENINGGQSTIKPTPPVDDNENEHPEQNEPNKPETPTEPETPAYPDDECSHTYSNGVCTKCGAECSHVWQGDFCSVCGQSRLPEMPIECSHTFVGGVCTKCGAGKVEQV